MADTTMKMNTLERAKDLFESILCLCVEGPEVMRKLQICEKVGLEALDGMNICEEAIKFSTKGRESALPNYTKRFVAGVGYTCRECGKILPPGA